MPPINEIVIASQGNPGRGVPVGGTAGQALVKVSSENYATEWANVDSTISVATANGFAGTVTTPDTTPVITLETTVTGLIKGNGTSISAASGSDINTAFGSQAQNVFYASPNGSTGNPSFRSIVVADLPTVNSNVGTFGTALAIPQVTVNAQGLITGVTVNVIAGLTVGNFASPNISQWTNNAGYIDTFTGENYLTKTGSTLTASAVNLTGSNVTGQLKATSFPILTGDVTTSGGSLVTTIKSSVALSGNPTTTTQTSSDNSTKIATTAFVQSVATSGYVPYTGATGNVNLGIYGLTATTLGGDISVATAIANGGTTSISMAVRLAFALNVKDFGAVGNGTTDDTAAFQAALATGKSIYVPAGTYLITTQLTVSLQILYGAGWRITTLITTANIKILNNGSSGIIRDLMVDGQNFGSVGITAGNANTAECYNVRVNRCARGFEMLNTQNSVISQCYAFNNDYNYYLDSAQNCKLLHSIGSLDTTQRTITTGTRNIYTAGTIAGHTRNLLILGGIYERGLLVNDYSAEFNSTEVTLITTEFNGGGIATVNQGSGVTGNYQSVTFSLNGTNYAINSNNASVYLYSNPIVSGSALSGQTTPFSSYFSALCVGGITGETPLLEDRFDYSTQGWAAAGGASLSYNATNRSLSVTTSSAGQDIYTFFCSGTPFDTNYYTGRFYKIACIISNISTTNPVILKALTNPSGSRTLGTLASGYNELVVATDPTDFGGFAILPNEGGAKTFEVNYFKASMI